MIFFGVFDLMDESDKLTRRYFRGSKKYHLNGNWRCKNKLRKVTMALSRDLPYQAYKYPIKTYLIGLSP